LTINALTASNAVLVPLQCEFFALEVLSQILKTVEQVRASLNPGLATRPPNTAGQTSARKPALSCFLGQSLGVGSAAILLVAAGFRGHKRVTFHRLDGDAAEFDPFEDGPGFLLPRDKLDMIEASSGEGLQEGLLFKGPADAAAPERGVGFELDGNRAAADDIADSGPAAGAEDGIAVAGPVTCPRIFE
jgi:hypothetical protein